MKVCVIVEFEVLSSAWDDFRKLVAAQAENSLAREPGCHAFDVWTSSEKPNVVFLHEIYADRAAFDAHLASSHFRAFDTATAPMVAAKRVTLWDRREGTGA